MLPTGPKKSVREYVSWTRKLSVLLLALSIAVVVAAGCGEKDSESDRPAGGPRVTLVDVAIVESENVEVTIRSVGSIEAVDRVDVAPEIEGIVERIHFVENQQVKKGDVLVQLNDRKLALVAQQADDSLQTAGAALELARATVRRTQADVESRKSTFERDKSLYEDGITSEAAYVESKAAYDSAAAAVEEAVAASLRAERGVTAAKTLLALAKERLSDARITAPLSGILGERLVSPGDYVESGQPLVELVVMDPLEISFSVPGKYRGRVRTGQTAFFSSPSVADRVFSGETTFMSPTADASTRSIKIKARLSNEDNLLQPGLFGAVRLLLENHPNAPVIPESAVVPRGDETYVYMVNDSKALLRKVVLGEYIEGRIEVLEGVKVGETVITAGQQKVADGFPVRVRESAPGVNASAERESEG